LFDGEIGKILAVFLPDGLHRRPGVEVVAGQTWLVKRTPYRVKRPSPT
jgi:hypothetical protein